MPAAIWFGAWALLLVLVITAWAIRAVLDVDARFGIRAERWKSNSRVPVAVISDKRLVWAWALLLAIVSVPAFDVFGRHLSVGASVALSGGVGLASGFAASAVAYFRLPGEVRRADDGGWRAILMWICSVITASALLVIVMFILNWWVSLAG